MTDPGTTDPETTGPVTSEPDAGGDQPAPRETVRDESERDETAPAAAGSVGHRVDLDAIERDLDDVETALARLAEGTYRVDEVTGEPLPDDLLERNPTARRG